MSRRHRSNYSLWPQQARPRRTLPLTLAAGGFAIGIVCAVAAHNVVTDFTRPSDVQEPVRQTAVLPTPLYATPTAAATDPVEPANRNRARPAAAKMTLPSIGTVAATPGTSTDGARQYRWARRRWSFGRNGDRQLDDAAFLGTAECIDRGPEGRRTARSCSRIYAEGRAGQACAPDGQETAAHQLRLLQAPTTVLWIWRTRLSRLRPSLRPAAVLLLIGSPS